MKKLLTFLLTALLAFSVGWAETATVTASSISSSNVTWTGSSNETWSVIVNGGATGQNVTNGYAQVGTKNSPSTSVTFSTSGITGTITSIVVDCASYNGLGSISATVGGNAFGNQNQSIPRWSTNTGGNVTFNGSASGAIVITMTNGSSGRAMYIKSITVTYTPGSTPPTPTLTVSETDLTLPDIPVNESSTTGQFNVSGSNLTGNVTLTRTSGSSDFSLSTSSIAPSNGSVNQNVTVTYSGTSTTETSATFSISSPGATTQYITVTAKKATGGGQPSQGTIYRKVTSTDDLVPGTKCIIVYENGASSVVLGRFNGSTTGTASTFSGVLNQIVNNHRIDIGNNSNIAILTLGVSTDAYTLYYSKNLSGLVQGQSGVNFFLAENSTSNGATWKISADGIVNNATYSTRYIRYYSSSSDFRHYTTSNGSPAYLYVQEDSDAPMMQVPESLSIEDATGDATGTLAVTAQNLTDGISVSKTSDYWNVSPNSLGTDGGNVTVEYAGRALHATDTITLTTATANVNDVIVPVDYTYTGDIYIVVKTPGNPWNFESGDQIIQMTPQTNGTYKTELTVPDYGGHNGAGDDEAEGTHEFLQLTQKVGSGITWGSKYFFGPVAGNNWWLTEGTMNTIAYFEEANSHVIQMMPGDWTITINPANNSIIISPTIADPVITLASGRYYDAQTTTITCSTELAHIYYTTDGSDPSLTNGTLYDGNPIAINADMTLKAVAVLGSSNPTYSNVVTANYTIRALDGTDYLLANTVTVNDEYVLVYSSGTTDYAMGTFNSDNYYNTTTNSEDFELNGTIVTRKSNNVNVLTIEPAGATDTYYIIDQDGYYLYFYNGNSNLVHRSKSLDANNDAYKWTITIGNDGVASIENVGTNGRYLRCNASNHRYACYTSGQNDAKLYKRAISVPRIRVSESELDLGTIEAGGASVSKTFTVHGMNLTQDVTLSVADAENFTVQPTTISATDANNGYVTVTVTYTGSATTASTTVTVANSEVTAQTVTVTAARTPLAVTISPASGTFSGSTMGGITIEANAADATIYYSLDDGQSWQEYTTGTSISVTAASIGDRPTVQAYAVYNGETSATVTAIYERVAKSSTLFEKVTSSDQIKAGNKYIFVYENGSYGLTGNGYTASIQLNGSVADIGTSPTTILTLSGNATSGYTLYYIDGEETKYLSHSGKNTAYSTSENALTIQNTDYNGYYVRDKDDNYYFCYNAGDDPFRWYPSVNGTPAYLYVQGGQIEAPEITPVSGTYYDNQTVSISDESDDVTIWYTTDGSDPATSVTRIEYNGQFNAPYVAGTETTIIAVAIDEDDHVSESATVTYTWGVPEVVIVPDSRNVASQSVTVTMTGTPSSATIYYTTDGNTPTTSSTQYDGAFTVDLPEVGDHVTVNAIAVYNGVTSEMATATYTRVQKMIDVHAPFFSPLEGKEGGYSGIYYGNQTLQIATSTENADIYFVIDSVSGTNPPASVSDPTKSSTHYTGPISMTVGKSYRVKAIAYIGDFVSTISEGYYIIKDVDDIDWPSASEATYYVTSCKEFNELSSSSEGTKFIFVNPVQVVYHSTYVNNGTSAEYCYVRDNTDYACIYFGKADTHNYHIFEMGDWIGGATIEGPLNVYVHNYHNQLGTSAHTINATLWPSQSIGWSEIVPETTTCTEIADAAPTAGYNKWGHYVHVRYSTMSNVHDETGYQSSGNYDMKHTGSIQDQTSEALNYYDKFYLWSAGTCRYSGTTYTINDKGDYTQEFFDAKQNAGATFDVYGVVDWYGTDGVGTFQVCPIDFLWIYKPVITINPGNTFGGEADTYAETQIVSISATQPEWAAENVVIYYKTDDMDDWAEYIGPFEVSSNTTVQTYAQVEAIKNDAAHTNYNDIMRSVTISKEFKFEGIKDPEIAPASMVIEVINGNEKVEGVVIADNNDENSGAVTVYTTDGTMPSATNGTQIAAGDIVGLDPITETTTVTAISYLPDGEGNPVLWSNPVTVTYTFVKSNGVVYDLVDAVSMDKVYVIVNKDAYMGLSTAQNGNNRGSTGVKFTDGTKEHVYGNDELALFVLESANAGRYYFKNINGNGYLTVTTNDVANLSTSATASSYSEAAVAIGSQAAGYPATITFNYDGTNRYLRYFAKGRTFTTNSDVTLNQDVFLYGTTATPLAVIESKITAGDDVQVTVADNLIGAWAINKPNGEKYLWAKDMGLSIDKTAPVAGQKDYVKNILHYQNHDWDQSNWVILDFSGLDGQENSPEEFVGKRLTGGTITGKYVDGNNYRIVLDIAPQAIADADAVNYPGYNEANVLEDDPQSYVLGYNTYIPTNFYDAYMNAPYGEGFVALEGYALGTHAGEKLFFMNPKVQEVARVWGIYTQKEDGQDVKDVFTCITPSLENMVNGWGIKGAFAVEWDYNRVNQDTYGVRPSGLDYRDVNKAFMFHAAIVAKSTSGRRANVVGTADDASNMSDRFVIYPLDFKSSEDNVVTGVEELNVLMKDVESVRYYNIMGMESEKPFEGINIVVTRYTDGSTSTAKILR